MRTILSILAMTMAVPVAAQVDPAATAQGQVLSATARGYAERDAARQRRGQPRKTVAQRKHDTDCAGLWQQRSRMDRQQRARLYDLCPR